MIIEKIVNTIDGFVAQNFITNRFRSCERYLFSDSLYAPNHIQSSENNKSIGIIVDCRAQSAERREALMYFKFICLAHQPSTNKNNNNRIEFDDVFFWSFTTQYHADILISFSFFGIYFCYHYSVVQWREDDVQLIFVWMIG